MIFGMVEDRSAAVIARALIKTIIVLIAFLLAGAISVSGVGELDASFGIGGRQIIQVAAQQRDFAKAVAVQSDGKIVIGAEIGDYTSDFNQVVLIRLNENGTPDSSFGTGGKAINPGQIHARAMAIQPDGKILVAGATVRSGITFDFAVVRYNSNGSVDTSFGTNGVAANGTGEPQYLLLQPDGRIIVIGSFIIFRNGSDYLFARFNSNGMPDPSFGSGGIVQTSFTTGRNSGDQALGAALQQDGKIVATGIATCISPAIIRYNENGTVDTTFGLNGTVLTPSFGAVTRRVVVQEDGKIIVGGGNFVAGRYLSNGGPDTGYGTQGIAAGGTLYPSATMYDMTLEPDGKLLLAGSVNLGGAANPGQTAFMLQRFTPDGAPDPGFGQKGVVITDFTGALDEAFAMALQPRNKVVLVGYAAEPGATYSDVAAARHLLTSKQRR
jgi:uncharacterized delta-60 repeat protein